MVGGHRSDLADLHHLDMVDGDETAEPVCTICYGCNGGYFFLAGGADALGSESKEVAQVVSFQGSGVDENTKDIGEWATESGVVILPLSSTVMSAERSFSLN